MVRGKMAKKKAKKGKGKKRKRKKKNNLLGACSSAEVEGWDGVVGREDTKSPISSDRPLALEVKESSDELDKERPGMPGRRYGVR